MCLKSYETWPKAEIELHLDSVNGVQRVNFLLNDY